MLTYYDLSKKVRNNFCAFALYSYLDLKLNKNNLLIVITTFINVFFYNNTPSDPYLKFKKKQDT